MITRYTMRQSLQGRALRQFTLRTGLFQRMTAAFTQVKENNPYLVFFLSIFVLIFFFGLLYLCYRMLEAKTNPLVIILFILIECCAIYFCFLSKDELSRFQAVFSIFLSYLMNLVLLEKLAEHVVFALFLVFLNALLLVFFIFDIVKYFRFFLLNFLFILLLVAYSCYSGCQDMLLGGFNLVLQLVFLYLLRFFFKKEELPCALHTLFPSLLLLLVYLYDTNVFSGDPSLCLKMIFLGSGSLVIHLCFLSTTGWEQVITSLFYISINFLIGFLLSDSTAFFFKMSLLYLTVNLFIFCFLWVLSFKTGKSLNTIFDKGKRRIVLALLVFLIFQLEAFSNVDSRNNWIWHWLTTFTSQLVALDLFLFFFLKKERLFTVQNYDLKKEQICFSLLFFSLLCVFCFWFLPCSALLPTLFLFWHINVGIEEIMADHVHQEMIRNWILIYFRLFLLIVIKDVFLLIVFLMSTHHILGLKKVPRVRLFADSSGT